MNNLYFYTEAVKQAPTSAHRMLNAFITQDLSLTFWLCLLVVVTLLWVSTRRPAGLPPGPGPALPMIGHLHLLDRDPRAKFAKWRRQFGDVFCFYIGDRPIVVLNGYNVIKNALVKQGDVFSYRPDLFIIAKITERKGKLSFLSHC